MVLTPRVRRVWLTARLAASVGWLGAVIVFLAQALVSLIGSDPFIARAAAVAMGIMAWFAVLRLSIASLATGLVQAVGTAWGLLRHYWVVAKLVLTVLATGVLLLKMAPISDLASAATSGPLSGSKHGLRISLLVHAVGGVLLLSAILALAIFKPEGRTKAGFQSGSPQPLRHGSSWACWWLCCWQLRSAPWFFSGNTAPRNTPFDVDIVAHALWAGAAVPLASRRNANVDRKRSQRRLPLPCCRTWFHLHRP